MPVSEKQRGRYYGLTLGLMVAGSLFSCTEDEAPVLSDASGGVGQAGGAESGGAPGGGTSSGGAAGGGTSSGGSNGRGDALGGPGGEAGGNACPAELLDEASPVRPTIVDNDGQILLPPVGRGPCPDGTVPSERVQCTDVLICACEYPCSPGCGTSEVCIPANDGNVCGCHPAMDGEPGDCHWTGIFDTDMFEDCDAWTLAIFDNGLPAVAEVADGALHLAVEQRCQNAFAQIVARRPPREVFPDGAALVFDYSAKGEPAEGQPRPTSFTFGSTGGSLLPSAEPREHRFCVLLNEYPALVELTFSVQNYGYGTCEEESPAELRVSNLRFEADEACR